MATGPERHDDVRAPLIIPGPLKPSRQHRTANTAPSTPNPGTEPTLSEDTPPPTLRRRLGVALTGALLLAALAPSALAGAGPWQENDQSRVRLVSPWQVAPAGGELAGGELILGLEFETIPDWHVYWKNSGDAGYPPYLDFAPTPEITDSEILWPAPERYHLPGDLVALGYEGHVVYPVRIVLDREAGGAVDSLPITADLDYLVCEVECIPYSYRLSLGQPLAAAGDEAVADEEMTALVESWRARVPRPVAAVDGVTTAGRVDLSDPESPALEVRFTGLTPEVGYEPELFLEASEVFDLGVPERIDETPVVEAGEAPDLRFRVPLTFRQRPETLPTAADFAWTLTGTVSPAGEAAPVEARRTVEASTDAAAFATGEGAAAGRDGPAGDPPGLPGTLLWAFLGGLLLHLTPTVLPLTVLRLATLTGEARPLRGATLTALGIASGALALLAWTASDPTATWGQVLQAPLPVAALALLATLVALHLWGLLPLPLAAPRRRGDDAAPASGAGAGAGAGMASAFLTGATLFALALVWDLPAVGRALGPALAGVGGVEAGAGGTAYALAALLALTAGLALPFLLAAGLPAARRVFAPLAAEPLAFRVAEALGFLEAGSVLWLLYLLSRQVTGEGIAYVQLTLLALAMVAWLRHSARRRAFAALLAAVLLVLAAAVLWLAAEQRIDTARIDTERIDTARIHTAATDTVALTTADPDTPQTATRA